VQVFSKPGDARVDIGGTTWGNTNIDGFLKEPGNYSIRISKPGYATVSQSVSVVTSKPNRFSYALRAINRFVVVNKSYKTYYAASILYVPPRVMGTEQRDTQHLVISGWWTIPANTTTTLFETDNTELWVYIDGLTSKDSDRTCSAPVYPKAKFAARVDRYNNWVPQYPIRLMYAGEERLDVSVQTENEVEKQGWKTVRFLRVPATSKFTINP
jgi:hypothetical protein